jgi:hypothetical protein
MELFHTLLPSVGGLEGNGVRKTGLRRAHTRKPRRRQARERRFGNPAFRARFPRMRRAPVRFPFTLSRRSRGAHTAMTRIRGALARAAREPRVRAGARSLGARSRGAARAQFSPLRAAGVRPEAVVARRAARRRASPVYINAAGGPRATSGWWDKHQQASGA